MKVETDTPARASCSIATPRRGIRRRRHRRWCPHRDPRAGLRVRGRGQERRRRSRLAGWPSTRRASPASSDALQRINWADPCKCGRCLSGDLRLMQFYRITHPDGRLEFSHGRHRGHQAGQGDRRSVRVDRGGHQQAGPAQVLQRACRQCPCPGGRYIDRERAVDDAPIDQHKHTGKEEHCPKCKFTPRQAEAYVASRKRMLNIDALKEWINERSGWELSTIIAEITDRLSDLVRKAS
jgi:hypothetical protein